MLPTRVWGWHAILRGSVGIFMLLLLCAPLCAQNDRTDTLRLSLPDAERIFMEKNLDLVASRYSIDASKALIEQAKYWDNPVLQTDQNIYANGKFFAHGKDANGDLQGQYFIQIQQLIKTAGKRGKLIDMATTNARINELQFNDLMRNLKYQLRSSYYTMEQLWNIHRLYQEQLTHIRQLFTAMQAQEKAGNTARKDLLRIQALQLSVQQDLADNDAQLANVQTDLRILLQLEGNQFIVAAATDAGSQVPLMVLDDLIATAKQNNPAYALQQSQILYQQQNLRYQKALRSPDITLGPEYDHNSNYAPHYVGLSVSLPLNIFNKNQGNIKAANFNVKQEETNLLQVTQQMNSNITNALNKLYITQKAAGTEQTDFYSEYNRMFGNVTESYRNRQINLLEFIDFSDAYREARLKLLQQQLNLRLAKEELNYQVGKDVIR
ncbi:TolC family protein [Sediminibacterium ginsengisoli]|uniref:Outer membrane protein, cobalt-zinc-cadmium efflux system n=1 Tax=Sediminibacterium ginsengisoli TaxID=413434 RepID=A0A1T4RXE9_9BACT|nr:TolC family protein [Sediminibacterium ginsengisoli]SKA20689.1 outer membrane protein, cobalt-zinc-cadmium efflux system [Sediminibacterium ginsengisoli]